MKVIATNIFDFTTWYKFGIKTISKSLIIDLADPNITGEELLRKTGFFEEEYEAFYLEIKDEVLSTNNDLIDISLYDTVYLIPISETGSRLLQSKLPDFKIFEPLDDELYKKLMAARDNFLALQGSLKLLASFNIKWQPEYQQLQASFLRSLSKYRTNLNAEQETLIDQVLFYERSKPYPLSDQGFLFDVGSIVRSRFGIQDDDIKNKAVLKESDPFKFELVEHIISLSKFLSNREIVGVWSEFVKYYENTAQLQALNQELLLGEELKDVNNMLVIGLYLKFRDMIRNTRMLEEKPFTDYIQKSLARVPEEASIALLLNGLFFGGLKFKELHYKFVPLEIARIKYVKPAQLKDIPSQPVITNLPEETPVEITQANSLDDITPEQQHSSGEDRNTIKPKTNFDQDFWQRLEPSLKKYHKNQQKKIKELFGKVINSDTNKLFTDHDEFFRLIRKELTNKKVTKEQSKITEDIVIEIEEQVQRLLLLEETINS